MLITTRGPTDLQFWHVSCHKWLETNGAIERLRRFGSCVCCDVWHSSYVSKIVNSKATKTKTGSCISWDWEHKWCIEAKVDTRRLRKLPKRLACRINCWVRRPILLLSSSGHNCHARRPGTVTRARVSSIKLLSTRSQNCRGDTEDLGHEVYQLKRLLPRSENTSQHFDISDILGLATFMEPYKLAFAELYRLLCITLVLCCPWRLLRVSAASQAVNW